MAVTLESPQLVPQEAADSPDCLTPSQPVSDGLAALLEGAATMGFHFQPIVDLERAAVIGYEALARFPGPPFLSPDKWFQIASRLGRRIELEFLAAQQALRTREILPPNCFLSVNVGPMFLLSDHWDRLLASQSALGGVVVEITEDESVGDYARMQQKLAAIREAGGSVAVDDAGAGYASLRHVMELAPNFIKLDRGFVTNCHRDRARSALIEMIGHAASHLDAWIIAEGVESVDELDELIRLRVPLAQGYFLARPLAEMTSLLPEKAEAILARSRNLLPDRTLSRITESATTHPNRDSALQFLRTCAHADVAMVVDRWSRPAELVERHPVLGPRVLPAVMKIQQQSDLAEVLLRALTRQPSLRFDPLAAINERGEFLGIVRVDRLMRKALENGSATAEQQESAPALQYSLGAM